MAKEKWYVPVNIGMNMDLTNVVEEKLDDNYIHLTFIRYKEDFLSSLEKMKDQWLQDNDQNYKDKFIENKIFYKDKDHLVFFHVQEFSHSKVRVYAMFIYGHSLWNHYCIVLKNYLINRNEFIDKEFNLVELEKTYSFTYKHIEHGMYYKDVEKQLGKKYYEYIWQPEGYKTIYYKEDDIEIIIQEGIVKYLVIGKPQWMDSSMIIKPN